MPPEHILNEVNLRAVGALSIGILTQGFPSRGSGQHGRIRPLNVKAK